jgi:hypothetical protein
MLATDLALALDPALVLDRQGLDPDPWQAQLLRSDAQQTLMVTTRQGGKSTATAALALHTALYTAGALILLLAPALAAEPGALPESHAGLCGARQARA